MAYVLGQRGVEFEALEGRALLSGNVEAVVTDGGDLIITGDKAGNAIAVTVGLGGEIVISGAKGTTVNGENSASLTGLTGDVVIRMGEGSDEVALTGLAVGGDLKFDGGRGDNQLALDATSVDGQLTVKNLMGKQTFSLLNGSSVGGNLKIDNTQKGDTTTTIDASTISGKLQINNKDGDDTLSLTASTVSQGVAVNNNKGDSDTTVDAATIGKDFFLQSMKGADQIDILNSTSVAGKTKIATGEKGATINLTGLSTKSLQIQTGDAADTVTFDAVAVAEEMSLQLGKGNDTLTVTNGLAPGFSGRVKFDLGQGDDDATITAAFGSAVMVNGGQGTDSLTWLAGSTFAQPAQLVQMETVL